MSTVILLNIDGKIINVAHIVSARWIVGSGEFKDELRIVTIEDSQASIYKDSPASRAAYAWLLSLAVDPVMVMGEETK